MSFLTQSLTTTSFSELPEIPALPLSPHASELHQLENLVSKKLYAEDGTLKDTTEELIKKFQSLDLQDHEKEQFQKIHSLYTQQQLHTISSSSIAKVPSIKTELFTAKISKVSKGGIQKLLHVAKKWQKLTKERYERAKIEGVAKGLLLQVEDSRRVLKWLIEDLENRETRKTFSFYIAYTEDHTVQAIGEFGECTTDNTLKLFLLATAPGNIALFKEDSPCRGGGSAILSHITHEVQSSEKLKKIPFHLISLPSAAPFYLNQGFEKIPSKKEEVAFPADITSQKSNEKDEKKIECGYESDSEEKFSKTKLYDMPWGCTCNNIPDAIQDVPDLNVEFAFPLKAQMQYLEKQKTKNVHPCQKFQWKKLRSGMHKK
jgi:hypothetical protein